MGRRSSGLHARDDLEISHDNKFQFTISEAKEEDEENDKNNIEYRLSQQYPNMVPLDNAGCNE
jgi:hypothetical protein